MLASNFSELCNTCHFVLLQREFIFPDISPDEEEKGASFLIITIN